MKRAIHARRPAVTSCPTCGVAASGKFCGNCGGPLEGARCPVCDTTVEPGSRFCHNCSHRFGRVKTTNWIPYALAGVAVAIVVAVAISGGRGPEPASVAVPGGLGSVPLGGVTNAAPGSPRAQADGYFDRAMRAFEGGDLAVAASAGQMALSTYTIVPERDPDLRFHMGLLFEIDGNREGMLAQADSILLANPDHLFGLLLRARVYTTGDDSELLRETYRRFLDRYEPEVATGRPEYQAHRGLLERFGQEARRALGVG